jgi:hypothetical protein
VKGWATAILGIVRRLVSDAETGFRCRERAVACAVWLALASITLGCAGPPAQRHGRSLLRATTAVGAKVDDARAAHRCLIDEWLTALAEERTPAPAGLRLEAAVFAWQDGDLAAAERLLDDEVAAHPSLQTVADALRATFRGERR